MLLTKFNFRQLHRQCWKLPLNYSDPAPHLSSSRPNPDSSKVLVTHSSKRHSSLQLIQKTLAKIYTFTKLQCFPCVPTGPPSCALVMRWLSPRIFSLRQSYRISIRTPHSSAGKFPPPFQITRQWALLSRGLQTSPIFHTSSFLPDPRKASISHHIRCESDLTSAVTYRATDGETGSLL